MNRVWTGMFIGLVLLAAGCTSSLTGTKLEPNDTAGKGKLEGIPYQLPRPRFTISKVEADSSGSANGYRIELEYEPDPDQRYMITMDPAWLTDIEFELNFGELGQITSTTSDTTEQLTPAVTAVGEFFVSALSSVAKIAGAADTKQVSDKPPFEQVKMALTDRVKREKKIWNEKNKKLESANPAEIRVGEALSEWIETFKTPEAFLGGFHCRSQTERRWLVAAKKWLADDDGSVAKEPVAEVTAGLNKYDEQRGKDKQTNEKDPGENFQADSLRSFAKKLNSARALKEHAALWKGVGEQNPDRLLVTQRELDLYINYLAYLDDSITMQAFDAVRNTYKDRKFGEELWDLEEKKDVLEHWDKQVKDKKVKDKKLYDAQKILIDAITRAFAMREKTAEAIAMLDTVIDMPWKTWSYRHVLYLEKQINTLVQKSLLDSTVDLSDDVAELRKQRASALGVLNEFERALSLRSFLSEPRVRQETNEAGETLTAPAMGEYAVARSELDALEKKIMDARLALVPENKAGAVKEDGADDKDSGALPGVYPWITCSAGEKVTSAWIKKKLADENLGSPDFVIVLEKTPPKPSDKNVAADDSPEKKDTLETPPSQNEEKK